MGFISNGAGSGSTEKGSKATSRGFKPACLNHSDVYATYWMQDTRNMCYIDCTIEIMIRSLFGALHLTSQVGSRPQSRAQ